MDVLQLIAARGRKGSLEDKRVFGAYGKAIKALNDLGDALKVAGHWSPDDTAAALASLASMTNDKRTGHNKIPIQGPRHQSGPRDRTPERRGRRPLTPPPTPQRATLDSLPLALLPKFPFEPPEPETTTASAPPPRTLNGLKQLMRESWLEMKSKCIGHVMMAWSVACWFVRAVLVHVPAIAFLMTLVSLLALTVHLLVYPEKIVHLAFAGLDALPSYVGYVLGRVGAAAFDDLSSQLSIEEHHTAPSDNSLVQQRESKQTSSFMPWSLVMFAAAMMSNQPAGTAQ